MVNKVIETLLLFVSKDLLISVRLQIDRRSGTDVDGRVLHRLNDERDLILAQMRVERQPDRAVGDFLRHQEIAAPVSESK